MCITFFYLSQGNKSRIRFMIAFNRDQDQNRETLPFGPFEDDGNIYAGKDVISGGSWLGINVKTGIMVILTNYKLIKPRVPKSRGLLVRFFLSTSYPEPLHSPTPAQLSQKIQSDMTQILQNHTSYSAFNISVYNIRDNRIFYMCSQIKMKEPLELKPGLVHGYSNTDIGSKWEKVERGRGMFQGVVKRVIEGGQQGEKVEEGEEGKEAEKVEEKVEEIFGEMSKIMKNKDGTGFLWKYLQPSIFIPVYYSFYKGQYKMTKSTFYAIFTHPSQNGPIEAHIREVSYNRNNEEKMVELKLAIQM